MRRAPDSSCTTTDQGLRAHCHCRVRPAIRLRELPKTHNDHARPRRVLFSLSKTCRVFTSVTSSRGETANHCGVRPRLLIPWHRTNTLISTFSEQLCRQVALQRPCPLALPPARDLLAHPPKIHPSCSFIPKAKSSTCINRSKPTISGQKCVGNQLSSAQHVIACQTPSNAIHTLARAGWGACSESGDFMFFQLPCSFQCPLISKQMFDFLLLMTLNDV